MNVSSVKLFLEVAEAGSLSKVAARRQTVQSHVSRQITDFEARVRRRLFRRTGRGVALTELGAARGGAAAPMAAGDRAADRRSCARESGQLLGEVRLGIIPSAAHPLMTRLFERLQADHPGIRLDIAEAQGAELDAMLDSGAVDLAILFRFHRPSGRDERLLCVAHTYLVSAPGDPLTREPTLNFSRLAGLRLVLPRRPSHWRNALDETARSLGFKLEPVAEADSLTVQKELVARRPRPLFDARPLLGGGRAAQRPLQASKLVRPDLSRHVTLALPKQGKLSPACRVVAETVQHLVASWGRQLFEPAKGAAIEGSRGKRPSAAVKRTRR